MDVEDENAKAVKQFIIKLNESQKSDCTLDKLSTNTILKFLTARKFNIQRAVDLYISHQEIRKKENLFDIDPWNSNVRKELLSEKLTVLPLRDNDGSGILLFTARLHVPRLTNHSYVLQGLVVQLDAALESPETQKNGIVFIYDMTGSKFSNFDYELSIKILKMLRGSYPARLKKVLIVTAPLWFKAPFKVLRVFMLEKLRDRVHILNADELKIHLPNTSIPTQLGGTLIHDHQEWLTQCLFISSSSSSSPHHHHHHNNHQNCLSPRKIAAYFTSSDDRIDGDDDDGDDEEDDDDGGGDDDDDDEDGGIVGDYSKFTSSSSSSIHDGRKISPDSFFNECDDDDDGGGGGGDGEGGTGVFVNGGDDDDDGTSKHHNNVARKRSAETSSTNVAENKPTKKKPSVSSDNNPIHLSSKTFNYNGNKKQQHSTTTSTKFSNIPQQLNNSSNNNSMVTNTTLLNNGSRMSTTLKKHFSTTSNNVANYDCSDGLSATELQQHFDVVNIRGLEAEYNMIKTDSIQGTINTFKLKANQSKNRYSDVVCLDQTRVPIQLRVDDSDDGDYIHANYVDGYYRKKAYICTQGPMPETFGDFWQMVWEQKVMVIVMTTKLVERGRTKCGQYWPRDESTIDTYNDNLAVINCGSTTESNNDIVTTTLLLQNIKMSESREVKHVHFLGWPDYGVPSSAESFLELMYYARELQATMCSKLLDGSSSNGGSGGGGGGMGGIIRGDFTAARGGGDGGGGSGGGAAEEPPIVVHCSAGIGRSGTYIAIDIMTEALTDCNKVNVMEVIRKIRAQRALSIQMSDQYVFCYRALLCYARNTGLLR